MGRGGRRAVLLYLAAAALITLLLYRVMAPCGPSISMVARPSILEGPDHQKYEYHREMPLIFIGGVPRSGTTLMRAMLDAHPEIRCGQETRVIPRILQMRNHWLRSQKESLRLEEAGLSKAVLDSAIAAFCLEIIARHGDPAPRLCNKDPLTLKSAAYLAELFPNAKFLFMVRDGRATVHSIISRKVTITGFDLTSYRQCLGKWNSAVQVMHNQCSEVGESRCLAVPYEQLVLHPRHWLQRILAFLDVPWNESVMHHEQEINKPGGVSLSKRPKQGPSTGSCRVPAGQHCLLQSALDCAVDALPVVVKLQAMLLPTQFRRLFNFFPSQEGYRIKSIISQFTHLFQTRNYSSHHICKYCNINQSKLIQALLIFFK
ncbi:hypothetical protein B566_EDAN010360 [Ephemera danica]|nr:hypothetical protein B566_EDAN010360 [Ephemera danica]